MRYLFILLLLVSFFFSPAVFFVRAEDASTSGNRFPQRDFQEERKLFQASREAEMKGMKEEMAKKRQEILSSFKANLEKIKDSRKKQVVENVDDRIANRNAKWVLHWNEVLKRLTDLISKVEQRAQQASGEGKDISTVTAAITTARSAIASAQAKVDAQSNKTYEITVSDEATLRSNVRSVVQSFHSDVKIVITSLNEARRSVEATYKALRAILAAPKPSVSPNPSPTVTTSPTPSGTPII